MLSTIQAARAAAAQALFAALLHHGGCAAAAFNLICPDADADAMLVRAGPGEVPMLVLECFTLAQTAVRRMLAQADESPVLALHSLTARA
eukprot:5718386-Pyramimonas_sp.AAC.1